MCTQWVHIIIMKTITHKNVVGLTMSEKFDGVQGNWDGRIMRTRTDNQINIPALWAKRLPVRMCKGELWAGRGQFETVKGAVCSNDFGDCWSKIKFLPFDEIPQIRIRSKKHMERFYKDIVANGGEGIVITDEFGNHFKKTPVSDDDGELVGFSEGKGRNSGKIGAFILKLRNGKILRLSAGLSDNLRIKPPAVGTIIKFKSTGLTSKGLPRFASFVSIRAETILAF